MEKWLTVGIVIFCLALLSFAASKLLLPGIGDRVAVIPIEGTIGESGFLSPDTSEIVSFIEEADSDESIRAIILLINSPGGSPVASEEIMKAVKSTNKTTVAVIRDIGTSGAYWIASAADTIVASPMSTTGSIGVVASYIEYTGLMQKLGLSYERLVAGDYKDIGAPYRNLTNDERMILQEQLDQMHEYFIESVAENRHMDLGQVKNISTGMFYTGHQAKKLGLVDELGGQKEAEELIKSKLNLTEVEIVQYAPEKSLIGLLSQLASSASFQIGRGIGTSLGHFSVST